MSRSVNKIFLLGRIGKQPDFKALPGGGQVCNISVATSETWKDKNGEKHESVSWHNVVAFNKLAQAIADFAIKGTLIYLEGHLKYEKYTDKNSIDRVITKIVMHEMRILSTPNESQNQNKNNNSNNDDFATSADSDDDFFNEDELPA